MTAQARMIDAIPVVTDATARDAWWPVASRPTGARVHRLDTNTIERWDGAAWQTDFAGAVASEAMTAPTLLNAWVNYGSGVRSAGYYKGRDGRIYLTGSVKSGTLGLAAFTLPAGYRPSAILYFAVMSSSAFGWLSVDTAGNVTPQGGSALLVALDGVSFTTA